MHIRIVRVLSEAPNFMNIHIVRVLSETPNFMHIHIIHARISDNNYNIFEL